MHIKQKMGTQAIRKQQKLSVWPSNDPLRPLMTSNDLKIENVLTRKGKLSQDPQQYSSSNESSVWPLTTYEYDNL